MIIKGGSRGGPEQLARHLQRRDTNEIVEILETLWPSPDLDEAFRDWQTLSEGTRGQKGLYHVNIDPAKGYVMSMEQWQRSVEVLEKELGFEGLPRAVVLHQKHGRQHLHIVWARTDVDTMTLRSDSQNYLAHERASKTLELEFGHEPVPGKHAKRDRNKQKDFPRAEYAHSDWQQGERAALTAAERRAQVTALKQASDSPEAFKAALEDQGYVLAKGDKVPFLIVDGNGEEYSLARYINGMNTPQLRAFMKGIDREALPTAEEAAAIQQERRQQKEQPVPAAETLGLSPEAVEAIRQRVAAREAEEAGKLRALHAHQSEQAEFQWETERRKQEERFQTEQRREMDALKDRLRQETSGLRGFLDAIQARWNPALAAEKAKQRRREIAQLKRRQEQERRDYFALMEQTRQLDLGNLQERQAQQLSDHRQRTGEELERHIEEAERAQIRQAELEAEARDRGPEQHERDGREWPPPRTR